MLLKLCVFLPFFILALDISCFSSEDVDQKRVDHKRSRDQEPPSRKRQETPKDHSAQEEVLSSQLSGCSIESDGEMDADSLLLQRQIDEFCSLYARYHTMKTTDAFEVRFTLERMIRSEPTLKMYLYNETPEETDFWQSVHDLPRDRQQDVRSTYEIVKNPGDMVRFIPPELRRIREVLDSLRKSASSFDLIFIPFTELLISTSNKSSVISFGSLMLFEFQLSLVDCRVSKLNDPLSQDFKYLRRDLRILKDLYNKSVRLQHRYSPLFQRANEFFDIWNILNHLFLAKGSALSQAEVVYAKQLPAIPSLTPSQLQTAFEYVKRKAVNPAIGEDELSREQAALTLKYVILSDDFPYQDKLMAALLVQHFSMLGNSAINWDEIKRVLLKIPVRSSDITFDWLCQIVPSVYIPRLQRMKAFLEEKIAEIVQEKAVIEDLENASLPSTQPCEPGSQSSWEEVPASA